MRSEEEILQLQDWINGEAGPPESWSRVLYDEDDVQDVLIWILEQ